MTLTALEKKKRLTLYMIIIFSVLLVATTEIKVMLTRIIFQIILFSSQLLIVKSLLDDVYQ
ncbi:MAG TPA: hypothetical protein VGB37_16425 [Candidatus Lokiarchaeia archaeon]